MREKVGFYLVMYLIMVLAMFTVWIAIIAYFVDFDYFFWNSGAIPFSAWWNLMVENFILITVLSFISSVPVSWYMLK